MGQLKVRNVQEGLILVADIRFPLGVTDSVARGGGSAGDVMEIILGIPKRFPAWAPSYFPRIPWVPLGLLGCPARNVDTWSIRNIARRVGADSSHDYTLFLQHLNSPSFTEGRTRLQPWLYAVIVASKLTLFHGGLDPTPAMDPLF